MIKSTLVMLMLGVSCNAVATEQPAEPIGIVTKDFFRQYDFRSASVSPDGKLVAAIENPEGDYDQLVIKDVDSGAGGKVYASTDVGESISHPRWISNDILLFTIYNNNGDWELYSAQWQGIEDGKPLVHIGEKWGYQYSLVDPLLSQGGHALISTYSKYDGHSEVHDIDFDQPGDQAGQERRVARIDGYAFLWLTDQKGEVTIAGTYGEEGVKNYWMMNTSGHWVQFRSVTPKEMFWPISYAPDGKNLIVETDAGRDSRELWIYDPVHDKFLDKVYGNKDHDVEDTLYDWNSYRVTGVTWYQGSVLRYEFFDKLLTAEQKDLEKLFPGYMVNIVDGTSDEKRVLVFVSDSQNPGTYYVYDEGTHKIVEMGKRMPWLTEKDLAPVESSSVKSADGLDIEYLIALPSSGSKPPYPVVVMPHGGPLGVLDTQDYNSELQFIVNHGYAVIQVNYRGSGGGGKSFYDAGKGQWGQKIEDDIETAVHAALKKYPLDADRVCIYGESYGGYSALMSTIRDPALYKCAASMAGVMDVPLIYQTSDWADNKYMRQLMIDITGNPDTQLNQLTDISPVYNATKLTRPVFIAQGALDERVDQEQAYRMRAVLDKLGKPYKFQIYQNEEHGFSYVNDQVEFYDKLINFFNDSLNSQSTAHK